MPAHFSESDVSLQYPENWKLEREEIENGWLITIQSPETAFFMLCRRDDSPTAKALAGEALEDLRDSYPEMEEEPATSQIAGRTATGFDVRFFYLDLTNTAWLRTFRSNDATFLVMWQVNDLEMDSTEQVLRAITSSLTLR
jgi:hypothetical protein